MPAPFSSPTYSKYITSAFAFLVVAALALGMPSIVFGVEIEVTDQGTIIIYEDRVLGDTTLAQGRNDTRAMQALPATGVTRSGSSTGAPTTSRGPEIKRLPSQTNQRIQIQPGTSGGGYTVDVINKQPSGVNLPSNSTTTQESRQRYQSERLDFVAPAQLRDQAGNSAGSAGGAGQEVQAIRTDDRNTQARPNTTPTPSLEYIEQIRAERRERVEEQIEVRGLEEARASRMENQEQIRETVEERVEERQANQAGRAEDAMERRQETTEAVIQLRSRDVGANVRGSDFEFDPETNELTITTPSGESKTLNHLPDQALERIKEQVAIANDAQLEVETDENGDLIYKGRTSARKRLFGLLPRQVQQEVILNDSTGVISEREVSDGLTDQILNFLSF